MNQLKPIAAWTLSALLAAFFAVQGYLKVAGSSNWVARFRAWGYPDGFSIAVGAAELIGAALLLWPKYMRLGILLLGSIMAGAAITHLVHGERQAITPLVVGSLLFVALKLRAGRK